MSTHPGGLLVEEFADPQRFVEVAGSYLAGYPFTTNVLAVHVVGVLQGQRPRGEHDRWFAILGGGRVRGVAFQTPPRAVAIAQMDAAAPEALAAYLAASRHNVPGVSGERVGLDAFVSSCTALIPRAVMVERESVFYRLERLQPSKVMPGAARIATELDRSLVGAWFAEFLAEAVPDQPIAGVEDIVRRRIDAGEFVIWDEAGGRAVSFAGCSRPGEGVARIGPVYTPPRHGEPALPPRSRRLRSGSRSSGAPTWSGCTRTAPTRSQPGSIAASASCPNTMRSTSASPVELPTTRRAVFRRSGCIMTCARETPQR